MHAVSHVLDRDLGGNSGDPWAVSGIALVLAVALALRIASLRSAG